METWVSGMDRKEKGVLAEAKSITEFISLGYNVFKPFADNGFYDLIVEKDDKLYKVSVKYSSVINEAGSCCVTLKTVSRRKDNKVKINTFDNHKYDILSIYDATNNKIFLIDCKFIESKNQFNFKFEDYDNIMWRVG